MQFVLIQKCTLTKKVLLHDKARYQKNACDQAPLQNFAHGMVTCLKHFWHIDALLSVKVYYLLIKADSVFPFGSFRFEEHQSYSFGDIPEQAVIPLTYHCYKGV